MSKPKEPLPRLAWMLSEHFVRIKHTTPNNCRCCGCYTFRISWEDCNDVEQFVEDDRLEDAINAAWWSLEGE